MIYKALLVNFLAFFLLVSSVYAEVQEMSCIKKLETSALEGRVSSVEKTYASVKSLRGSFAQYAFLEALNSSEVSEGDLIFLKPGRMRWVYKKPEPQQFISDGQTLWLHQPMDNQVIVDNFKSVMRGDIPVSFLLGLGSLSKDFKVVGGCEGKGGIVVDLLPAKKDESLQRMKLLVDASSNLPAGAEITDAAGNKNTFILKSIVSNGEIPNGAFVPSFPKGTDVVDNRKK
jgi:outer membrane lipoprotein carrier protein